MMKSAGNDIAVVIPVYKAERCLNELYTRLTKALDTISNEYQIIFVEDCGGDRSWEIICMLSQNDSRVKGLQFSRNFGQHYGITAGLDACDANWVVVMDCDLQDRPEEIPRLYAKALEGNDIVLARRGKRKDSFHKRLSSQIFYWLFNYLSGMKYDAEVGNYRIFSRKVLNEFLRFRENLRFFGGLMEWMGFPVETIDVQHAERHEGQSTYTYRKLFKLAFETIIAYSDKPLRISINLGFFFAFVSFLYGVFIIYNYIIHGVSVEGWASIVVSLYFLGGIIMSILGILGVYLGKVFDETKNRPLYIISKTVGL